MDVQSVILSTSNKNVSSSLLNLCHQETVAKGVQPLRALINWECANAELSLVSKVFQPLSRVSK